MKILVSACLLGINCRYDGTNCANQAVIEYLQDKDYITVCPEQLGGLSTPRLPSEIRGDQVFDSAGNEVTAAFVQGAKAVLQLALENNCELAILKSESPSCGKARIFDGSFSGNLTVGDGITVKILQSRGLEVVNEDWLI